MSLEVGESPRALLERQAAGAWALWLSVFAWSHAVTLTTRRQMTPERLHAAFRLWHQRVERMAQQQVTYFWAIEEAVSGSPHLHALIGGAEPVAIQKARGVWSHGLTAVTRYDPALGAAGYFTKSMLMRPLEPDAYDVSWRLPPQLDSRTSPEILGEGTWN